MYMYIVDYRMQDSFVLWQWCVCLFYCTFSGLHFVYLYLFYITCILLWYTLSMHTFFVHLVIADNFLSFVPSFYFLQHSCNSVRIFVSFSSLVYGIATVSDSAVACRVQLAVVRVCVCACVRVCVCVCVCVWSSSKRFCVLFLPTMLTDVFFFFLYFSLFFLLFFFLFFSFLLLILAQVYWSMQLVWRCETARLPPQP